MAQMEKAERRSSYKSNPNQSNISIAVNFTFDFIFLTLGEFSLSISFFVSFNFLGVFFNVFQPNWSHNGHWNHFYSHSDLLVLHRMEAQTFVDFVQRQ